jgi:predicted transglutaminase-like cysteine proteinase
MLKHVERVLAILFCVCNQPAHGSSEAEKVLPPFAFALFCARYPVECADHPDQRVRYSLSLPALWRELNQINSMVNFGIVPKSRPDSSHDYNWQIFPLDGNCADYAVTKRHMLIDLGWPTSSLLLAEVVIRTTGEHHLILIAKEATGNFVLDNLSPSITRLSEALTRYDLVRVESAHEPRSWTRALAAS